MRRSKFRRPSKLEYFDRVFEELAKGPKRWSELKEATEIPEKTLARILERISKWGVASKNEEGKWILNAYTHLYYRIFKSEEEKKLYLKHSEEEILPGLYCLLQSLGAIARGALKDLGFDEEEDYEILEKLEEDARSHIKTGYPELHEKIEKCFDLWEKMGDLINSTHPDLNLVWIYDIPLKKPKTEKFNSFLARLITLPWDSLIKMRYKRQVARLIEMKDELLSLLKDIYGEINLLIIQIERRGEPLLGECPHCPRITIES